MIISKCSSSFILGCYTNSYFSATLAVPEFCKHFKFLQNSTDDRNRYWRQYGSMICQQLHPSTFRVPGREKYHSWSRKRLDANYNGQRTALNVSWFCTRFSSSLRYAMPHAWLVKFQGANDLQGYLLPFQGEVFFAASLILPGLHLLVTSIVLFL